MARRGWPLEIEREPGTGLHAAIAARPNIIAAGAWCKGTLAECSKSEVVVVAGNMEVAVVNIREECREPCCPDPASFYTRFTYDVKR